MSHSHCDAKMGPDFKGIERFYPPEIIVAAHQASELVAGFADGKPFSVSSSQLRNSKGPLLTRFKKTTSLDSLKPMRLVLNDLENAATGVLKEQPMLPELGK
jgi:hypothetical protein